MLEQFNRLRTGKKKAIRGGGSETNVTHLKLKLLVRQSGQLAKIGGQAELPCGFKSSNSINIEEETLSISKSRRVCFKIM